MITFRRVVSLEFRFESGVRTRNAASLGAGETKTTAGVSRRRGDDAADVRYNLATKGAR